jgi:hypothetical protein
MGLCIDKLSPLRKDLGYACPRISRNDSITLQTVMSLDGELNKSVFSMDLGTRPSGVRLEISSQFGMERIYKGRLILVLLFHCLQERSEITYQTPRF